MKEPRKKRIFLAIARKLAVRVVLVTALLSASGIAYASTGYWLKKDDWGWNYYLWCGSSAGNYYTKCPPCPLGMSCPCYACDTGPCQESADYQCAQRGGGGDEFFEMVDPPVN